MKTYVHKLQHNILIHFTLSLPANLLPTDVQPEGLT